MTGLNFIPRSQCHKTILRIMFKKIKVVWRGIV